LISFALIERIHASSRVSRQCSPMLQSTAPVSSM